jgi:hypothetical protein
MGMTDTMCAAVATRGEAGNTALMFARLGVAPKTRRCPFCESIIYSRRHKLCGVCASELPEEILFTNEQAQNIELMLREERVRHRAWMQRGRQDN